MKEVVKIAQPEPVVYQTISRPKLQAKVFTNWSRNDVVVVVLSCLVIVGSWVWSGLFSSLIEIPVALMLLFRSPSGYGRMYSEVYAAYRSIQLDDKLGGVIWQQSSKAKKAPIPLQFSQIEAVIEGKTERFCLLQQLDQPYDHLYIAADGGAFADLEVNEQASAVNTLATITNFAILRARAELRRKIGISYLRINGPYDPSQLAVNLRAGMDPTIVSPEQFDLDEGTKEWVRWARENSNQLRATATSSGGATNWFLIVLTIKRSRAWNSAKKGSLSSRQLYELPIVELGRSMVESLSSNSALGLRNVRPLGLAELASVVRSSWDVGPGINRYYTDRAKGLIPTTDEEIDAYRLEHGEEGINEFLQAWPTQSIVTTKEDDCLIMDGNWISTIRITKLPENVRSDQFLALQYTDKPGRWVRRAMVGQSVSGDSETNQLILSASFSTNFNNAFFGNRIVQNPKFTRKQRQLAQQTWEISANSVAQLFNDLLVVVSPSREETLASRKDVMGTLESAGFRCEVVKASARRLDAALSGSLGINRL